MVIGQMDNSDGTFESANRVYGNNACSPTVNTCGGGGLQPKTVRLIGGVSNRFGTQFKQHGRVYDKKQSSATQSVLGVGRDSLMVRSVKMNESEKTIQDYLFEGKDGKKYGIFKLSYRECLRLMNVRDSDIDKMEKVNSPTRCYMQAGNSIVVSVLCGIFSQLGIKGVKKWNDMTDEERYTIIKPGG